MVCDIFCVEVCGKEGGKAAWSEDHQCVRLYHHDGECAKRCYERGVTIKI